MIRVLIFLLLAIFFAGVITVLAGARGRMEIEAFGLALDIHSGFALGMLAVLFALAVYVTVFIKDLMALPARLRTKDMEARRRRGVEALARGLEAVAVGDATAARRHARVAQRHLDESSLTRFLSAQAAYLAGAEEEAQEAFSAMLSAPETEFLGLRGLYHQARRKGDKAAARGFAEKAFRLRPNAQWAFESVLELGLERGAWGETRAAIDLAAKNGILRETEAKRGQAALFAADAYAAAVSGDGKLALEEAAASLSLAPGFTPAALLAARLHGEQGNRLKAARILENAFAETPHPGLIAAHAKLFEQEEAEMRAEKMKRIADRRPSAHEAKLAFVKRSIILGSFEEAKNLLEPLLQKAARADECALMAEAVGGDEGPEASAASRRWLALAAKGRNDSPPGADGEFHLTRDGWARLVREFMNHTRLAPPPLEAAAPGISPDEIKLLAAPPEPSLYPPPPPDIETPGDKQDSAENQDAAKAVTAAGAVN